MNSSPVCDEASTKPSNSMGVSAGNYYQRGQRRLPCPHTLPTSPFHLGVHLHSLSYPLFWETKVFSQVLEDTLTN